MPKIDYSRIVAPGRKRSIGRSERNSFYLQRYEEPSSCYKDYYDYDTTGMKYAVAGIVSSGNSK